MVKSWIHDTKLNFTVNFFPNFFFSWKTTECQCCSESNLPQPLEPTVHQILFLGRHIRNIYRRKQVRLPQQFYHIVTLEKHHTSKHNGRGKQKNRTLRNGRKWLQSNQAKTKSQKTPRRPIQTIRKEIENLRGVRDLETNCSATARLVGDRTNLLAGRGQFPPTQTKYNTIDKTRGQKQGGNELKEITFKTLV